MAGRRDERFESTLAIRFDRGSGSLRNVSSTGIYFITDAQLQQGDSMTFTLEFDGHPGGPLTLKGTAQVLRVEPCEGKSGVGAAITDFEFMRLGEEKNGID